MEAKPFSIGFRIEHPQSVINQARWGKHAGHPLLGAADYKLVRHAKNNRAVYSFCMCPGGTVVAAVLAACLGTVIFWSAGFAGKDLPWMTWALGDLGVKLVQGVCLLLPFRLLMGKVAATH